MSLTIQTGTVNIRAEEPTTDTANPSGFTRVDFLEAFTSTPIVMAMVQSFNGQDTPGLRVRDVSNTGFEIRMNELVLNGEALKPAGGHTTETISWVAILT